MTVVTQHLGELMGLGDGEVAGSQRAAQSADAASSAAQSADASSAAVSAAQSADAASQVSHAVPAHAFDAYAFPFQSHEVFGLLPHSIGDKAEGLWTIAHQLATNTSALSLAIGGVLLGAVAVATVSTARVWKRGEEFAVASFGDRLTKVGTRYAVRQDAPIAAFADKHGVVRKPKAATGAAVDPVEENVGDAELPATETPTQHPAVEPKHDTWRARREAQAQKNEAKQPTPQPEPKETQDEPAHVEPIVVIPIQTGQPSAKKPAAKPAAAPAPAKKTKEVEREVAPPLVATDETKRPKTVRRQLFRRSTTAVNYAGAFHGSYGSFQQTDRLFARDYLKQTNDAFEAAYLKGKGPNLSTLKLGDNHRAERLFMMATRASFEDPQTALAALWQAVDEDRSDAVAWLRLAHFYLELGEFDHARRILEPLQAQADHLGLHIIVAASANSLAKVAAQRGELEQARKLFSTAIENAQKTDNPFMQAVANSNAGLLEASRKRFEPARSLLQRGVKGFEASEERVSAARTKLALGIVHTNTGDDEAAEKVWGEAAETLRNAGFEDEAAQVQRWLAGDDTPNAVII